MATGAIACTGIWLSGCLRCIDVSICANQPDTHVDHTLHTHSCNRSLDRSEVKDCLLKLEMWTTEEDFDELFDFLDSDKSGDVDW